MNIIIEKNEFWCNSCQLIITLLLKLIFLVVFFCQRGEIVYLIAYLLTFKFKFKENPKSQLSQTLIWYKNLLQNKS